MQEGKTIYTLSKSQLLYEATTSIGIGEKNETEIPVFFFFVSWENAESSFEDSVVKKIIKNITYTDKIAIVKLHTKLKVISDFYLYLEGCNTYIHWVDKNALGIGALSVRCTTLELPHVFPLKSLD